MTDLSVRRHGFPAQRPRSEVLHDPALRHGGACPHCNRINALRATRTDSGRTLRCRFVELGLCDWPGLQRPFRRVAGERVPLAVVAHMRRMAEAMLDDMEAGVPAVARVDLAHVGVLRSALRKVARSRGSQVRTFHVGDGCVEAYLS